MQTALALLQTFLDIDIQFEKIDFKEVFMCAIKLNLTIYDETYIYLSSTKKLQLLTLDKEIHRVIKSKT